MHDVRNKKVISDVSRRMKAMAEVIPSLSLVPTALSAGVTAGSLFLFLTPWPT